MLVAMQKRREEKRRLRREPQRLRNYMTLRDAHARKAREIDGKHLHFAAQRPSKRTPRTRM
jgi:hypothetical protein